MNTSDPRAALLVAVLLGWTGAGSGQPAANRAVAPADTQQTPEVYLSLKGGPRILPVVLTALGRDSSVEGQDPIADELFARLADDLRYAARFEMLVDSSRVDSSGWAPVISRWSASGARAVVRGELRYRAGRTELFATLYRLPDGRLLIAKGYPVERGQERRVAHRLSDDIVFSLTGQRGVAQTRIAFVSDRTGNKELWVMDADGYDPRPLTNDQAIAYSPDWSPDGKKLVYSSMQQGRWLLYLVEVATGARTPIRTSSAMNTAPAWSPDGRQILFSLNDERNVDLYSVSLAGWRMRRLTDHQEVDTEPAWSPDGKRIAFTSDRTGLPQVYLMNADGSDIRRLTWEPDAYEGSPAWSPDGRRLAFVRRGFDGFDVYLMELDGGSPVRLTSGGSSENPSWSPDGLQIAFCSTREGGGYDIWTMEFDGRNLRRLTSGGNNLLPCWSPLPELGLLGK